MRLSSLKRPFVCLVISEPTADGAIRTVEAYEAEVDAFEVNLTTIEGRHFRDIFASTRRPFISTNRRSAFMSFYGYSDLPGTSEEERARRLRLAVQSGSAGIDCELDMFDEERQMSKPRYLSREEEEYASNPNSEPAELSLSPDVAKEQTTFCDEIHGMGAEVVFSCHTQTIINRNQGRVIVSTMEKRGADFGKIVSLTPSTRDLPSFIETVVDLKEHATIPFNVMNVGVESILGRLLSTSMGSSWVYCRPDFGKSFTGQPSLEQVRVFFPSVPQTI